MARIYRGKVTELAKVLQEKDSRCEATEASRGLVDAIVLTPDQGREALQIEIEGQSGGDARGTTVQTERSWIPTTSLCKYRWLRGTATNDIWRSGILQLETIAAFFHGTRSLLKRPVSAADFVSLRCTQGTSVPGRLDPSRWRRRTSVSAPAATRSHVAGSGVAPSSVPLNVRSSMP